MLSPFLLKKGHIYDLNVTIFLVKIVNLLTMLCKSIKDIGPLFSLFDYPLLYVDTFYLNPPWKFFDPNPSKLPTFFMDGPFLLKRGLVYDLNVTIFLGEKWNCFLLKRGLIYDLNVTIFWVKSELVDYDMGPSIKGIGPLFRLFDHPLHNVGTFFTYIHQKIIRK